MEKDLLYFEKQPDTCYHVDTLQVKWYLDSLYNHRLNNSSMV